MHLRWERLPLAVFCEFASMAAAARSQRRLLRAGGAPLRLRSVMAISYAGNAVSVTLPLAGSLIGAAFSFRQLGRHGVDSAVVAWALAMSGVISSLTFVIVLGASTGRRLGMHGKPYHEPNPQRAAPYHHFRTHLDRVTRALRRPIATVLVQSTPLRVQSNPLKHA